MAGAYKAPAAAKKPLPGKPVAKATAKPKVSTPKPKATSKPKVNYPKQDGSDRPMVGNDKAFAKKYGKKSWNNGYTN